MAFAIFVVNKASGFNKESFGGKILTIFITVKFSILPEARYFTNRFSKKGLQLIANPYNL